MKLQKIVALGIVIILSGVLPTMSAVADTIPNNLDNTVDATSEVMNLTAGGVNGIVGFSVNPTNGDGKNGCNFQANSSLTVNVVSSNAGIVTASPSPITFVGCNSNINVNITPVTAGSTTITLVQVTNTTPGTFDLAPATFTVNVSAVIKTNPTLSVTNSPVIYNGSPQSAVIVGSVAGVVSNAKYNGSATVPTNVGTYAMTADFAPTDTVNYNNLTNASAGNFVINQASSTTTVTCPVSVVYTGLAQTPCTVLVTRAGDSNLTPTPTYLNNTNVDTASASYTYTGDANHTGSFDSKNFDITKADPICSISGYNGIYDGNAHGATGSCMGMGDDGELNTLDLGASYTDVPGGTANWTLTSANPNYNNASGNTSIVITQAPSIVTVTCPVSTTYTGLAQTPCTAQATGVAMSPVDVTASIVYGNNTNAGVATANASWAGDINHTGNNGSGGFTINPATLTITASSGSMIQGGTVPVITPIYSGFVNSETSAVLTTMPTCLTGATPGSTVGDYSTNCSGAVAANYAISYTPGTMHVYAWTTVFQGLFKPLSLNIKDAQKGSTIPVKFALNGGTGNFYGGVATLMICDETTPVCFTPTASGGSNTANSFRYDASAGQYIYNLSTKDSHFIAGHVYDFQITMFATPYTALQKAAIKVGK